VVIQQNSRKLLMMDILMSETCRAHKKWNKIASDIKLVFYSSPITMMHGPINIRLSNAIPLLSRFKLQFHPRSNFASWIFPWWFPFKSRVLSCSFPHVPNSTIEEFCCISEYSTFTKCFRRDRMPSNFNTRIIGFFNVKHRLSVYNRSRCK